jgi:hypothetical protein
MGWGMRMDVTKGKAEIVLVDDLCGDLPIDDLFEKVHSSNSRANWLGMEVRSPRAGGSGLSGKLSSRSKPPDASD